MCFSRTKFALFSLQAADHGNTVIFTSTIAANSSGDSLWGAADTLGWSLHFPRSSLAHHHHLPSGGCLWALWWEGRFQYLLLPILPQQGWTSQQLCAPGTGRSHKDAPLGAKIWSTTCLGFSLTTQVYRRQIQAILQHLSLKHCGHGSTTKWNHHAVGDKPLLT